MSCMGQAQSPDRGAFLVHSKGERKSSLEARASLNSASRLSTAFSRGLRQFGALFQLPVAAKWQLEASWMLRWPACGLLYAVGERCWGEPPTQELERLSLEPQQRLRPCFRCW